MKKVIRILLLALCFVDLSASPLKRSKALRFAQQLIEISADELRANHSANENNYYYIFNAKSKAGFVIVGGDESGEPKLLAYADKGSLDKDDLPHQLAMLLEKYRFSRSKDKEKFRSSRIILHQPKVVAGPLLSCHWGQEEPFNQDVPKNEKGFTCVTGCVATAMAQLMYHNKYPEQGRGSKTYKLEKTGKTYTVDFSQSRYDWMSMKNEYHLERSFNMMGQVEEKRNYTDKEANAVAKLMSDIGVSIAMQYESASVGGSAAYSSDATVALNKYFDYTARYIPRTATSGDEFLETIKIQLKANLPVIMCGVSSGYASGHAWVLDGLDENDYLHCNWGWQGKADGYYSLDLMSPMERGAGGGYGNYNIQQAIIIAHPNTSAYPTLDCGIESEMRLSFIDRGRLLAEIEEGQSVSKAISLQYLGIGNTYPYLYNGLVGVGLYDKDNQLTVLKSFSIKDFEFLQIYEELDPFAVSLPKLKDGTYKLSAICKYDNGDRCSIKEWKKLKRANEITVKVEGGKLYKVADNGVLRLKMKAEPEQMLTCYTKSIGALSLDVENLSSQHIEAPVRIQLYSLAEKENYNIHLSSPIVFDALARKTIDLTFNLQNFKELKAGWYRLKFFVKLLDGSEVEIENPNTAYDLEIYDKDREAMLSCRSFVLSQNGKAMTDYHIERDVIKRGSIDIEAGLSNFGAEAFDGTVALMLKDIEKNELLDIKQEVKLNLKANLSSRVELVKFMLDFTKLPLVPYHHYELHLLSKSDVGERDVWSLDEGYRYILAVGDIPHRGVVGTKTSVEDLARQKATIIYHKSDDRLVLRGKLAQIKLYNLAGLCLKSLSLMNNDTDLTMNLAGLGRGTLILVLEHKNGEREVHKLYRE